MIGSWYAEPNRGRGFAGATSSASCTTCVVFPPSVPPDSSTMSGRSSRIRWICSCGRRLSLLAITSITIAPAPSAARLALAAVISRTTPATIIWRPPPAELVEMYTSQPSASSTEERRMIVPSSAISRRPESSWSSVMEFTTPTVTSAKGSSTVVGASPRKVWRYTPSTSSIMMALVVVEPQSVATITLMRSGLTAWADMLEAPVSGGSDGRGSGEDRSTAGVAWSVSQGRDAVRRDPVTTSDRGRRSIPVPQGSRRPRRWAGTGRSRPDPTPRGSPPRPRSIE